MTIQKWWKHKILKQVMKISCTAHLKGWLLCILRTFKLIPRLVEQPRDTWDQVKIYLLHRRKNCDEGWKESFCRMYSNIQWWVKSLIVRESTTVLYTPCSARKVFWRTSMRAHFYWENCSCVLTSNNWIRF